MLSGGSMASSTAPGAECPLCPNRTRLRLPPAVERQGSRRFARCQQQQQQQQQQQEPHFGRSSSSSCRYSSRPAATAKRRHSRYCTAATYSDALPFPAGDQGPLVQVVLADVPDPGSNRVAAANANGASPVAAPQGGPQLQQGLLATAESGAGPPGGPQGKGKPFIPHRWRVVAMMALAFVLCNMDKVNMSVAVLPMATELGWSATDRGIVSSAFFWGYSLTQIPAGWISTRLGGARVLLAGVAFWSLGTVVAPPAARAGLLWLCASRVMVGLGEGMAPSSATNVMAQLVPEGERARAVSSVFGSLDLGAALGLLVCGPLIATYGWPSVFYLFAALGLVWSVLWPLLRPGEDDPAVPREEQPSGSSPSMPRKGVPWGTFLRSAPVWAINVAHFCYNWGYYTLLAWLPSYFELALGLDVGNSSLLTLIPYLAMTAMTPFVGPVADVLVGRKWPITRVRKLAQGVAFAGPALCMLACAVLTPAGKAHAVGAATSAATPWLVALLSVSFALGAWSRAGLYCNHQDLSPKYAGALLGLSNTAGALPGILGVGSVGWLLDKTNSWGLSLFIPTACFQIIGLVVYSLLASSKRQSWAKA